MCETRTAAAQFMEAAMGDESLHEKVLKAKLDEALRMAKELGFEITEDELKEAVEELNRPEDELTPEDMGDVTGGMAQVVGSNWFYSSLYCKNGHKYAARTGEEKEDYRYIWWSGHQCEYRFPDCGSTWWEDEDHDDPPHYPKC